MSVPSRHNRFKELDVLRGITAVMVMLFHYLLIYQELIGHNQPILSRHWYYILLNLGNIPVYFFFMISGFVIYMSLENCKTVKEFAIARFSKLFPVYWASVLLTFTIGTIYPLKIQKYSVEQVLENLTMFHGFFDVPHIDGTYWSLTYELGFYISIAMILMCGLVRFLPKLCFAWLGLSVLCALSAKSWGLVPSAVAYILVIKYIPYFIAGISLYIIHHDKKSYNAYILFIISFFIANLWESFEFWMNLLFLWGLFYITIRGWLWWIVCKPLVLLGVISYPLYLTHQMVGYRLIYTFESLGIASYYAVIITIALTMFIAYILTLFVEKPAQKWIRKNFLEKSNI